jgi:hypothetical protein
MDRPSFESDRVGESERVGVPVAELSRELVPLVKDGDWTETLGMDVTVSDDEGNSIDGDSVRDSVPRELETLEVDERVGLCSEWLSTFDSESESVASLESDAVWDVERDLVSEPRVNVTLPDPDRLGDRAELVAPSVEVPERDARSRESDELWEGLMDEDLLGLRSVWLRAFENESDAELPSTLSECDGELERVFVVDVLCDVEALVEMVADISADREDLDRDGDLVLVATASHIINKLQKRSIAAGNAGIHKFAPDGLVIITCAHVTKGYQSTTIIGCVDKRDDACVQQTGWNERQPQLTFSRGNFVLHAISGSYAFNTQQFEKSKNKISQHHLKGVNLL